MFMNSALRPQWLGWNAGEGEARVAPGCKEGKGEP